MTAHQGIDFGGWSDVDADLSEVSGLTGLIHALAARLLTQPGGLLGDPSYGYGLENLLSSSVTPALESQRIQNQLELDERVDSALVALAFDERTETLTIECRCVADELGPFVFTLNVSQLTTELLIAA